MKVLFIYPEHYLNIGIPGGISMLSAILKKHGHKVELFDTTFQKTDPEFDARMLHQKLHGGMGEKEADRVGPAIYKKTAYTIEDLVKDDPIVNYKDELQKKINNFSPDLIAVSSMTSTFDFCLDLLRMVKYDCKVLVGGIHPTIAIEDALAQKEVDIACYGEADDIMVELCNLMEAGKDYYHVKSLAFKMPDGSIKKNEPAPRVDVDTLPCPDWSIFDPRHLFRPFEGEIYQGSFYIQSRGCPMKCTYCVDSTVSAMTGGSAGYYRHQKASVTLAHLTELKEKYNVSWIKFADDSFLLPRVEHLEELGAGLRKLGIRFGCSVMPNTITEEKVKMAKEMGCVSMTVGVESGNAEIRRMVKRNYNDEALVERLNILHKYDIRLSTFNIVGFPGEARENVFETINLNRRLKADSCNVYILFPYPGTPIQIENKIPIRGADGRMLPVSMAKELRLSKMGPDELEGLQKAFNAYLHVDKSLWPIIELGEAPTPLADSILAVVQHYVVALLTKSDLNKKSLSEVLSTEVQAQYPNCNFMVPETLTRLFNLEFSKTQLDTIINALASTFDSSRKVVETSAPAEMQA